MSADITLNLTKRLKYRMEAKAPGWFKATLLQTTAEGYSAAELVLKQSQFSCCFAAKLKINRLKSTAKRHFLTPDPQ